MYFRAACCGRDGPISHGDRFSSLLAPSSESNENSARHPKYVRCIELRKPKVEADNRNEVTDYGVDISDEARNIFWVDPTIQLHTPSPKEIPAKRRKGCRKDEEPESRSQEEAAAGEPRVMNRSQRK